MILPRLYASMIMKNEAHNLDRCLTSIRDLCDEIVIVDTGSTDNSIEIAEKYGAKVFKHPHTEGLFDFSKYRNISLDHCRELKADWCLIIDGDEELRDIGITPEKFKRRLTIVTKDVHALAVMGHENQDGDYPLSFWGIRFFRLSDDFHYEGIVHNSPILPDGTGGAATNISIYHYGYTDPQVMIKKRARTAALLEERLKENPDDYDAMFYKVMTLFGDRKLMAAVALADECIEKLNTVFDGDGTQLSFYGKLFIVTASAYLQLWRVSNNREYSDRAYAWMTKGLEFWPEDLDLNYMMCNYWYMAKDNKQMKEHARQYKRAIQKYNFELDFDISHFEVALDLSQLAVTKRGAHCATESCRQHIDKLLQECA